MRARLPSLVLAVVVPALVIAAALGGARAVGRGPQERAPLAAALDAVPAGSSTVDYTHWAAIDRPLAEAGLSGVSSRSVVGAVDDDMREVFGWSVTDLDWEAYARTGAGPVSVLGLGSVSVARAERSFEAVGEAVEGEPYTWRLDDDAPGSSGFAAIFGFVRVVPDRGLVLAAGDPTSLAAASTAVDGDRPSLLDDRQVADLARRLVGVDALLLQDRPTLCASSIGADEGADDEGADGQLSAALAGVGRLADPRWGARALTDGDRQQMVFAMAFDSASTARTQLPVRRTLTEGTFIGRSGQVADSLLDRRERVDGEVVSFAFGLTDEAEQFMTDTGPVVFAGCAPA